MVFVLCRFKNKKLLSQQQKDSEHKVNICVASCAVSGALKHEGQLVPQERYDENTGGFKTAIIDQWFIWIISYEACHDNTILLGDILPQKLLRYYCQSCFETIFPLNNDNIA